MIALLTLTAWFVWLLIYWNGGTKALADIRAAQDPQDRLVLIGIGILTVLLSVVMLAVSISGDFASPNGQLAWNGFVFVALGMSGAFYSRWTLGRFWTAQNAVQTGHRIITEGLYGIVRHPIYASMILLFMGIALVYLSVPITLLAWGLIALYAYKTRVEDAYLQACLPGYARYSQRVSARLIPFVW
ncbi:MAG: isoprenylcysteine carboxylmethyltransferase family protein [Anaerolineae bacterium]|nr:isoprenylcysteine carboxylmethyltransferase family protein [Chloroflexota bacterium]MBN8639834.1 isoprenylcysteine carboxylmethyltransferase family protein [Anaerolineae bacterium]